MDRPSICAYQLHTTSFPNAEKINIIINNRLGWVSTAHGGSLEVECLLLCFDFRWTSLSSSHKRDRATSPPAELGGAVLLNASSVNFSRGTSNGVERAGLGSRAARG